MSDIESLAEYLDSFFKAIEDEQDDKGNELLQLIGQEIIDLRLFFEWNAIDGWMDYCHSFLVIKNKGIMDIPLSRTNSFIKRKIHPRANRLPNQLESMIIGQLIKNIYDQYENEDSNEMLSVIIQLSNDLFIRETNIAPHGTGNANLFIYNIDEFREYCNSNDFIFKPLIKTDYV